MATDPPSLAEQLELFSKWDAGEHPTILASVHYHHRVHGGGMTLWEYLRAAVGFDRSTAARVPPTGTRRDGTVRFKRRNGEFLIERDGKILSYGSRER
jgi:hypothetical protein